MLPLSSSGRSCATQHRMGSRRIATRAARSRIPPTMPCGKSVIWQKKLSTSCRKQNPNCSGKPGQNLFHNMSSLGTPCSLLRHRGTIHRKASHREISLCANRLLQSGRSQPRPQMLRSLRCGSMHRMRKRQRPRLSIQLRGFMKTQRLFLRKQCHRQWNILCVNRLRQSRRKRFLLQIPRSLKCGSIHRLLTHLCSSPGIQLRRCTKSRTLFTNRKKISLCVNRKHQ